MIRFHVNDLMSSHKLPQVNDDIKKWLQQQYGGHGKVTAHQGKVHNYLGMIIDYTEKGKVKIDMVKYIKKMIEAFPMEIRKTDMALMPATECLFNKMQWKKLNKEQAESFHNTVAKGLFVSKRARADIHPTIAVLCTCVKDPDESDWEKLV